MEKSKILVIGSLNMDLVVNVPYMPKVGETILGHTFKTIPGGKGANQAFAAARLGGNVSLIGNVGNDEYGAQLVNNLNRVGVNVDSVKKQSDTHTGLAFIYVNDDGDNNIVVVSGANKNCSREFVKENIKLIEESEIVILQLEVPLDTVSYVLETAKELRKMVILNPAPAPEYFPEELLRNIDIITPNESELQKLTGIEVNTIDEMVKAAKVLLSKGVKTVIVTCGEKGAIVVEDDNHTHFPVPKVKAIDTTAAGDSFTAAVAVALSEKRSMAYAIEFANRVAAIVVTREGAQTSIPTREEVDK